MKVFYSVFSPFQCPDLFKCWSSSISPRYPNILMEINNSYKKEKAYTFLYFEVSNDNYARFSSEIFNYVEKLRLPVLIRYNRLSESLKEELFSKIMIELFLRYNVMCSDDDTDLFCFSLVNFLRSLSRKMIKISDSLITFEFHTCGGEITSNNKKVWLSPLEAALLKEFIIQFEFGSGWLFRGEAMRRLQTSGEVLSSLTVKLRNKLEEIEIASHLRLTILSSRKKKAYKLDVVEVEK